MYLVQRTYLLQAVSGIGLFVLLSCSHAHRAQQDKTAQENFLYLVKKMRVSTDTCKCCKHRLQVITEGNKDDKFNGMTMGQVKNLIGTPDQESKKLLTYRMCVQDIYHGDTVKMKYWGRFVVEFSHKRVKHTAFLPLAEDKD